MSANKGYYRFPTVHRDTIAFVSEDDLWTVPATGGLATRLTAGKGQFGRPAFSPDGMWIATLGTEEGSSDVYVMPANGGPVRRLTFVGAVGQLYGWTPIGEILFSTIALTGGRRPAVYSISPDDPLPVDLRLGPTTGMAVGAKGQVVLERGSHRSDPAHWKRYRGGTAGQLWTAGRLDGEFKRILANVRGNLASAVWVGDRIHFISDHENIGNVYSCKIDGKDLRRHTHHEDFYARNLATDGKSMVYHAGGDLYVLDPTAKTAKKVEIEYRSQRPQRQRKSASVTHHFESCHLSPDGQKTAYTTRGRVFHFHNWQGPILHSGHEGAVRYRLGRFLAKDEQVLAISDSQGKDQIEIFEPGHSDPQRVIDRDIGRVMDVKVAPTKNLVAVANHRNELIVVDVEKESARVVAQNAHAFTHLLGFAWSPDSRYLAYVHNLSESENQIHIYDVNTRTTRPVTKPGLEYGQPTFDPSGKFLYFLSKQKLASVYADGIFDISFPRTRVPCLVTLQKDTISPFIGRYPMDDDKPKSDKDKKAESAPAVKIEWEGIESRVQAFPVTENRFTSVHAGQGRVFFTSDPVESPVGRPWLERDAKPKTVVHTFNFKTNQLEEFLPAVSDFQVNAKGTHYLARFSQDLRVNSIQEKTWKKNERSEFSADSGWINLQRISLIVDPVQEWKQMFGEVWRLQRDHFWVEDMSGVNWVKVFKLYQPLIERISSRTEFSDLVWEMQGELGTSHAYDIGGDVKPSPTMNLGKLGADFEYNPKTRGYRIARLFDGNVTEFRQMSPLRQPGLNLQPGDELVAIDGNETGPDRSPQSLLINRGGQEVEVTIVHKGGGRKRHVVHALYDDTHLRYRQWVEDNLAYVHEKSKGRVGYVHIPDMSAEGFAEFMGTFLREYDYDGLVVDVRFNGGGHTSQLVLDYLSRRRLGVDQTRWVGVSPYPAYSLKGPVVALTNQYAGSDGDIFSHTFKLKRLGPLIGTRTWGGVIGIYPRNFLADGGITTQPEFSFWFSDVGWGIENHGTDPDIEIDIAPHQHRRGQDPQLDRAVSEALKAMGRTPPFKARFKDYPKLGV